jgi:hypothetical protein
MKNVIISITEFLATVLPYAIAEMIVQNIMEYGCIEGLETTTFPTMTNLLRWRAFNFFFPLFLYSILKWRCSLVN